VELINTDFRLHIAACRARRLAAGRPSGTPGAALAWDAAGLRTVRLAPAPRGPGLHLQLRMHILLRLRHRAGSRLPELRWRACRPAPSAALDFNGQL